MHACFFFFFKQKTAYEMRISDWSSDVCSSDLQCNLETASASSVSAAGGAPDFARAAKTSRSGLSIIALPATAARGTASRIVGQMGNPGIVTIPRNDVDLVVTEHGVADLRGKSVHERAQPHIGIASCRERGGHYG